MRDFYSGNDRQKKVWQKEINRKRNIISILPGSRSQEVKRNLKQMLEVTSYYPDYKFIVATTKNMFKLCENIIGKNKCQIVILD